MYKITNTTCPKCGNTVHGVRYVRCGDMEIDSEKIRHSGQMKRECWTCGYYWYEDSLDRETAGEKLPEG